MLFFKGQKNDENNICAHNACRSCKYNSVIFYIIFIGLDRIFTLFSIFSKFSVTSWKEHLAVHFPIKLIFMRGCIFNRMFSSIYPGKSIKVSSSGKFLKIQPRRWRKPQFQYEERKLKKEMALLGTELLYESLCLYICMYVCSSVTLFFKPLFSATYTFYRYTYKI